MQPTENHASKPRDYAVLLSEIKQRIRFAQYAALKAVNQELVGLALLGHRADDCGATDGCRLGQGGGGTTRRRSTDGVSRRGRFFGAESLVHATVLLRVPRQ